jgi:tetratricopeptide (TPR) repeat protein
MGLALSAGTHKLHAQQNASLSLGTGETYAVVVGISDYQDENIPDLQFADKDALAFAGFLQSKAGGALDEDHLKVLINEQATVAQFAMQLDWLWEVAKENDKVIIYFSGHGDVEKKSITQPGYLLCWDAPARVYLAGGSMNVRDLNDVISTISIQNKAKVILITDACRAGKLSGSEIHGSQATASNLSKQYANEIKILSCQPNEYSIEGNQWGGGRGAFSYHLLDGLYGMADANEDQTVTLKEISRYLEDKVSEEVAPENQNPMTIGSVTETLTVVDPELLAQIRTDKIGQMNLFSTVASRGIEDEVLAAADSNIVEKYRSFQLALSEKRFLEPANDCAEYYYASLSNEAALEPLHSYMRRNYAAALQDDAQQVMNLLLKTGLDDFLLSNKSPSDLYKRYPDYLEKAAELLGKDHYMYPILQARKNLFLGKIQEENPDARLYYKKALKWQADMPHAYLEMITAWDKEQADSAVYYTEKAMEQIPSWIVPFTRLASYFTYTLKDYDRSKEFLSKAAEIDSTSILVYYQKGNLYKLTMDYPEAEKWLLKAVQDSTNAICFPCAHNQLATIYIKTRKFDQAEIYVKKSIALDSTFGVGYGNLSIIYENQNKIDDARLALEKAMELGYVAAPVYNNMGAIKSKSGQHKEAIIMFKKALEIDSNYTSALCGLGVQYRSIGKLDSAEFFLNKALSLEPDNPYALNTLGIMYSNSKQYQKAEEVFFRILQIDSTHAPAWINIGDGYMETGRYSEAEQAFRSALKINSPYVNPFAHDGLGKYYMETGDFDEAEKEFKSALTLNPNRLVSSINLMRLYLRTEELEKADSILTTVVKNIPNLAEGHFFKALVEWKRDKHEEAWVHLEKAFDLGLNPGSYGFQDINLDPKFEEIQKDDRWKALIKTYLSDQGSDDQ